LFYLERIPVLEIPQCASFKAMREKKVTPIESLNWKSSVPYGFVH
jgi:hypothetical protein